MQTIKEVKAALAEVSQLDDTLFTQLATDSRAGVQMALKQRRRQLSAAIAEEERLEKMLSYEKKYYQMGVDLIAGIDEVGRGPLAGPVVAAAVILPRNSKIKGLNDSKKIPKSKHQAIYREVLHQALAVGIGIKDHQVIDQVNIYEATKLAMLEAIGQLEVEPQVLLIDAMTLDITIAQEAIIKGDANSLSIAAASIVAKVTRDQLMADYDKSYPGYDFTKNAGYGTKSHLEGLAKLGITPIHRKSFEPIKSMLKENKRGFK